MKPKHPNIHVRLSGEDGNAFSIIGRVTRAMKDEGLDTEEVNAFRDEAMSGDYDNVLQTCMKWVSTS